LALRKSKGERKKASKEGAECRQKQLGVILRSARQKTTYAIAMIVLSVSSIKRPSHMMAVLLRDTAAGAEEKTGCS